MIRSHKHLRARERRDLRHDPDGAIAANQKDSLMNADLSTMIGGQPMFVIRRFLRQGANSSWSVSYVRRLFSVSESEAQELVARLARRGYIKKSDNPIGGTWWEVSAGGKRLALATSARKISRETADRLISALLQRTEEVNARDQYLFRVKKITAFGAYVEGEASIDDIDVEIELEQKQPDETKHLQALAERVAIERSMGRVFVSHSEELGWGEREVLLYLRSRSRYLSFIRMPTEWRKTLPCKILFND